MKRARVRLKASEGGRAGVSPHAAISAAALPLNDKAILPAGLVARPPALPHGLGVRKGLKGTAGDGVAVGDLLADVVCVQHERRYCPQQSDAHLRRVRSVYGDCSFGATPWRASRASKLSLHFVRQRNHRSCRWGLNERRLDRLRRGELAGRAFVNALHRKGADRRQGAHEHHGRFADVAFLGRRLVADIILHEQ